MRKIIFFVVSIFCIVSFSRAQMVGSEQVVPVQVYQGTFIVEGDYNTYYPVVFKYGNQDRINHIRIYRRYNEPGPEELNSTHKGNLTLEIDVNYGGWGGSAYDWRVMDLRQTYHNTFAGATLAMHNKGFIVWLRGGGFQYHYESEKGANIQVALNQEIIFDHTNDVYDVYAPAPKTEIDWETINAHKNDNWNYIKDKDLTGGGTLWQKSGDDLYFNNGMIGIGTNNPNNFIDINDGLGIDGNALIEFNGRAWVGYSSRSLQLKSGSGKSILFTTDADNDAMRILTNGNVAIGTNNPGNYKLAVEGVIGAREVKVTTDAWADFVFEPDYNLMTLSDLKTFIQKNKHLPEVPTAKEVEENGISVGEMNAKLLQKVEELTLYIIQLEERVSELEKK